MLIDTHCHIHEASYPLDANDVIVRAHKAGVMQMICVGTSEISSRESIEFASKHDNVFASIGIHPYYAKDGIGSLNQLIDQSLVNSKNKLVAIGEIGLDYYNNDSPIDDQIKILKEQIELALKYDLPIIFHVRDAYDDFWKVLDSFQSNIEQTGRPIRGVVHCFTDNIKNASEALKRGFYIGVNGISTFTKEESQKAMFASLPIDKIILETDAPFLTPNPLRGKVKVNEPAFVKDIAEFNGAIRQITFDEVANTTTANARALFNL